MKHNIRRNAVLIVILIISALITGCSPAGGDAEQGPPILDSDSKVLDEAVQNPAADQEDEDKPEEMTGTDADPIDETPAGPTSEANPAGPPASESPDRPTASVIPDNSAASDNPGEAPSAEIPDGPPSADTPGTTSTGAIQSEPGDLGLPPDQSTASGLTLSPEWELLASADVNHDGLEDDIYLDQTEIDNGYVTLRVCDSEGNVIWSEGAGISHVGWNSIFLMEQGGTHYLLQYNPSMGQGYGTYTYILFILEGADENVISGDLIDFDTTGVKELDVPRMVSFAENINTLLGESILLVSSEGGEFAFGPSSAEPFFERYSWLDQWPELYEEGDDLETRLTKYSEFAVSRQNHFSAEP